MRTINHMIKIFPPLYIHKKRRIIIRPRKEIFYFYLRLRHTAKRMAKTPKASAYWAGSGTTIEPTLTTSSIV